MLLEKLNILREKKGKKKNFILVSYTINTNQLQLNFRSKCEKNHNQLLEGNLGEYFLDLSVGKDK